MNKPIRYYSNNQQNHLQYNYPIQQYSTPINLNRNRFQQEDQIYYIQNDFQKYDRQINQDHQLVEQKRTNFQNNNNDQEISRNFANNNDHYNNNNNDNSNSQEIEQFELKKKFCRSTDLLAVLELVIAIILLTMFYYIKGLQQYLINEDTFELNELSLFCILIPCFILYFIVGFVYRVDKNPPEGYHITAIVTLTLVFQYSILCYGIVLFKTLNQGFIYIQISLSHIILILFVFIVRPRYNISIRKCLSIIIVSTLSLVLFISIFFQDKYFWWMFGIPVIIYLLFIKMFEQLWMRVVFDYMILVWIHLMTFNLMIIVILVILSIKIHLT